jgi:serine/threonine protein kinase
VPINYRVTRAVSQEVDNNDKSMATSEAMDYDDEIADLDDEGEPEIVLIEEEYKEILDKPETKKSSVNRSSFKFLKLIGSGAHAKVYLARKTDNKKLFAIKVLDKRELNRKKQVKGTKVERKILVSINPTNI